MPVNGPIYLVKENNVSSEQTFQVVVQVTSSVPPGRGIQLATLDADYRLSVAGKSYVVLSFGPREQRINFSITLFTDTLPEGMEGFLVRSAPGHPGQLPDGTTLPVSVYLNPIALSAESFVLIEDDDREFYIARCVLYSDTSACNYRNIASVSDDKLL